VSKPEGEETKGAWSSRSIGTGWQHRIFYLLIRLGGRRAAYLLLYFVVLYYVLLRPDQRRKSEYYLRRRFPEDGPMGCLAKSYRMSLQLGKVLVDRAVVGILGPEEVEVDLGGQEELLSLLGEGKGLVLMTAHVGCWQVAMSALGFLSVPVSLLMQREEGDLDRHYFEHAGLDSPYRIIDPRGFLGGTMEMLGVLKNGEVLSVMGDRMLGDDHNGVAVTFLGAPILIPYSAFKLASATGAPVAVLLSWKSGPRSYRLKLFRVIRVAPDLGRRAEAFAPYAQEFSAVLEEFTRDHPFQFFNFYDMWQTSPPRAGAGSAPNTKGA
jgi:predicted LPLAT superfamily acyltransferase